jgi:glycosyltransferase involved in cell wall biosynthesis
MKADAPLVSVLIPVFNAAAFLAATLDSVLAQTWPNLEIIVVDDGSTDRSAEIIEQYRDRGVEVIRQDNLGSTAARNRAFAASNGAFVQFLDHDDLIDPDKITIQMRRLIADPLSVASCEAGCFTRQPEETRFEPLATWSDLEPREFLTRNFQPCEIVTAQWLIPRPIAEAAGPWNEALGVFDDREYLTRIVLAARWVLFCPGARCRFRIGNPGSLSQRPDWASRFAAIELCQKHFLARFEDESVRSCLAIDWQELAHACLPYDPGLAKESLARGKALHPIKVRPGGGSRFRVASSLLGWRMARRLQAMAGRR